MNLADKKVEDLEVHSAAGPRALPGLAHSGNCVNSGRFVRPISVIYLKAHEAFYMCLSAT
jgi:hypothetical protein